MKIYCYKGNGFYLGSTVIVKAKSIGDAITTINCELNRIGLSKEIATESNVVETKGSIIHSWNGDY